VTHRHSQHTVCDGVSGVTKEGYLPGVPVCLVSGTGSAVRVVQGVFSVFFVVSLGTSTYIVCRIHLEWGGGYEAGGQKKHANRPGCDQFMTLRASTARTKNANKNFPK
jgi:hypothetical protein